MKRGASLMVAAAFGIALSWFGQSASAQCGVQHVIVRPVITQVQAECPTPMACPAVTCGPSEVLMRERDLRLKISDAYACGKLSKCEYDALMSRLDCISQMVTSYGADNCISYLESRNLYKNWDKIGRAYDSALEDSYDYSGRIASVQLLTL